MERQLDNFLTACSALNEALSRFAGRRALVVESERGSVAGLLARQFDSVENVYVPPVLSSPARGEAGNRAVVYSPSDGGSLPYKDAEFETVVLYRVLTRVYDWRALIREGGRLLNQRGNLVVIELGTRGLTDLQTNAIELEKLFRDRDAMLVGRELPWPTPEELRAEMRARDVHHIRIVEYTSQDYRCDSAFRQVLKRESLDRMKSDLMLSLGKLGRNRDEVEHRLIALKRRIEVMGVELQPVLLTFGMKKTVYSAAETTLFAAEALAPETRLSSDSANELEAAAEVVEPQKPSEIGSLQTGELISLLLSGGESTARYEKLATRLVKEYGSRAVADEHDADRLAESFKISRARALQIIAAFELGRRFFARSADDSPILRGPEDVFRHVSEMANLRREQFRGLYLNSRQRLVADEVISIGTLTSAVLHPREVFRPALTQRAASVILVHNHPSGDPEPSAEDVEMTRQISAAGRILGIELLDHVIIGGESWFSMKDAGMY